MKNIVVCFLVLLSCKVSGQDPIEYTSYAKFEIIDGDAVWINIYNNGMSKDSIRKVILHVINKQAYFKNIREESGEILAKLDKHWVDYKKYGGIEGIAPAPFRGDWNADVTISIKDSKYRVKVQNLIVDRNGINLWYKFVLRWDRKHFDDRVLNYLVVMSNALGELFDFKAPKKEDW